MKYSYIDWNRKYGTVPVIWTADDYKNTEWLRHQGNGGFNSYDENYDIYSKNIGVLIPKKVLPVFEKVKEYFDLDDIVCDLSKYNPGMLLPWHTDTYPTYSKNMNITNKNKIVRIIIFLHDSLPGQQLWIEDMFCFGKAGSWFSWAGDTKHMAANLGENDRYVIQLTGHL